MEEIFHQNVSMKNLINSSIDQITEFSSEYDNRLSKNSTGYKRRTLNANHYGNFITQVIELIKCNIKNIYYSKILFGRSAVQIIYNFINISMLKKFLSMEFDTDQIKSQSSDSSQAQSSAIFKDNDENSQISNKKICNSSNLEENTFLKDFDASPENPRSSFHGKAEPLKRYSQSGENVHVTQSRSIFSHKNSFVYGNPKEDIKNIENPSAGQVVAETLSFRISSPNVLDLSFKGNKLEEEKLDDGHTYQKCQKGSYDHDASYSRSSLEIKVINPGNKKPSLPEQLQIAKMQQQQRRSMQQQQKLLQQMRKSLDSKTSSNRQDSSQSGHAKFYGNNSTNHEFKDADNHGRVKDDFYASVPNTHFPQLPYSYFDPNHLKELPDNHPILPLLDPVYFSALYNAHGFLPPSSPSIAAAFIGTLQDAFPKLPMVFPSTSSNNSILSQKSNENPN